MSIKSKLVTELKKAGAFDVRIADPLKPVEYADAGRLPIKIWPLCKSIIVFITANPTETNNTYLGVYSPFEGSRDGGPMPKYIDASLRSMSRLSPMINDKVAIRCVRFLQREGFQAYAATQKAQMKLYALQSGLGVYGRSGVILNPVLGNRINIGMIFTDAVMESDEKLEGFNPCENCEKCIQSCPANAYGESGTYHKNWDMQKCSVKRDEIEDKGYYCHNCFAVCPACTIKEEELFDMVRAVSWKDVV